MISYNYECDFILQNEGELTSWIGEVIQLEHKKEGEISYIFCSDDYLYDLNVEYLDHRTLTDIISFDYSMGNQISGDIFISVERVMDNSKDYKVEFDEELRRVMVHGILHYCGYKDKSESEQSAIRAKEDEYLKLYPNS